MLYHTIFALILILLNLILFSHYLLLNFTSSWKLTFFFIPILLSLSSLYWTDPLELWFGLFVIHYSFHILHLRSVHLLNSLSAALRSNAADYVSPVYFLKKFFYSTLVLRTDFHQIFRNCVFWCSLNNTVVLKFFGRHLAEKNAKNSENLVKISRVDSDCWQ